jgi:hypothetical protein
MAQASKLSVPLLIGLLVTLLLGPAPDTTVAAALGTTARTTVTRTITIAPAAFMPYGGTMTYLNNGYKLHTFTGTGLYYAPLFFEASEVTIRRMTLYAVDNGTAGINVSLHRTAPLTGSDEGMGAVGSTDASSDVRAFTLTSFSPRRVTGSGGPYLQLSLPYPPPTYDFFGVRIIYEYEAGA